MTAATAPRRVEGFRLEQLDGELLLYHPGRTRAIHLNETASLIWQLCDGARTTAEIVVTLQEAYPDHHDEIPRDVEATLRRLRRDGAIDLP